MIAWGRAVSIHARRVTGDDKPKELSENRMVSIHARRVTGDSQERPDDPVQNQVSIHARRVTGDVRLTVK